jgi:hypothetical protein
MYQFIRMKKSYQRQGLLSLKKKRRRKQKLREKN